VTLAAKSRAYGSRSLEMSLTKFRKDERLFSRRETASGRFAAKTCPMKSSKGFLNRQRQQIQPKAEGGLGRKTEVGYGYFSFMGPVAGPGYCRGESADSDLPQVPRSGDPDGTHLPQRETATSRP